MTIDQTRILGEMHLAPYIQIAAANLIGKSREGGGNMFRHQIDTMGILIDYGHVDSVLLKAAIVHDVLEDVHDFNHNNLISIDFEGHSVYSLVQEVSRRCDETKVEFLKRIRETGSQNAKILKTADRISNMISLGFVNNLDFVERYIKETEEHLMPIAVQASNWMVIELNHLVASRKKYLESFRKFEIHKREKDSTEFL